MKAERINVRLKEIQKELKTVELKHLQVLEQSAQASHCSPLSGDITLCAILCDGMNCGDFEHGGGGPFCAALIKCKGFTGDGDSCKAFEIVGIR